MSVIKKYQKTARGQAGYVALIDDKKKYENIKQYRTLQDMTKDRRNNTLVNNYKTLFNLFKSEYDVDISRNNLKWVNEYYLSFVELVTEHYGKDDINSNTSSVYFNSAARLLLAVNKSRFREFTRQLFLISKMHKQKAGDIIQHKEYEPFQKLKVITDDAIKRYRTSERYSDIVDALIMAFNVYMPPLRHNITDFEISRDTPLMTDKKHTIKQNYIWIDGNKIMIVINYDKVSNKSAFRGRPFIIDLNKPDIKYKDIHVTNYKLLKELIFDSLKRYPRFFLLTPENRINEPLASTTYLSKLKKLTRNPKMSQNVFRRSFISYYYPRVSKNIQQKIAANMRHSTTVARAEYQTFDRTIDNDDVNIVPVDCKPSHISNVSDPKLKYYLSNKDNILRRKIITYLNSTDGKPQKRTVDRYNLKYDDNDGWY